MWLECQSVVTSLTKDNALWNNWREINFNGTIKQWYYYSQGKVKQKEDEETKIAVKRRDKIRRQCISRD